MASEASTSSANICNDAGFWKCRMMAPVAEPWPVKVNVPLEGPYVNVQCLKNQEFVAKTYATRFYPQSLIPSHPESPSNIVDPNSLWEKPPNPGVPLVYHCLACQYKSSQKASVMMHARCIHLGRVVASCNCDRAYYKEVDLVTHSAQPPCWYPKGSVGWDPSTSPQYCYQGRIWRWYQEYVNQSLLHN